MKYLLILTCVFCLYSCPNTPESGTKTKTFEPPPVKVVSKGQDVNTKAYIIFYGDNTRRVVSQTEFEKTEIGDSK